jgi:anthranilate synthase component 2
VRLLILDNYDSFTFNLVHLVEKSSNISFDVRLNDKIDLSEVNGYSKILLSPGPGIPSESGIMPALLKQYTSTKNILGVCLGQQAIAETFGASLKNLDKVMHGLATPIQILEPDPLFKNCPSEFNVGRYHSWAVDPKSMPESLKITAVDNDGEIMALQHKTLPIWGVQFHPESILSEYGEQIISNWLSTN